MDQMTARQLDVLLTAQEAYPALERQFLQANREIIAGFRIFDPWTKLLSSPAQDCGETWFDLVVHTLNRGVRVSLILSDFDPVVRPDMHQYAWGCVRGLLAAAEASQNADLLCVRASMHPARVGLLPRLLLWPRLLKEIRGALCDINTRSRAEKEQYLAQLPRLRPLVKWRADTLVPRLAPPPLVPVTHHQKLAVFDRQTLYIGGLDLNNRRYDTPQHQRHASETWHDCQLLLRGPVAQEAAHHLETFEAVTGGRAPEPKQHLLRTISAKRRVALPFLSPKVVVSELAKQHAVQIARSEHLIYLESQFFRDRRLAEQLAQRAMENIGLSLILILPAAPEDAAFADDPSSDVAYGEYLQAKSIEIIKEAFGARVFIGSPAQPRAAEPDGRATHYNAPIIYLHAKVSIFDDVCAIVSSANLNGRSMAWDTEAGIATDDQSEVTQLKERCFKHWLGPEAGEEFYSTSDACAAWSARAAHNAARTPNDRTGFILPHAAEPGAALGHNLPGVPDEMV